MTTSNSLNQDLKVNFLFLKIFQNVIITALRKNEYKLELKGTLYVSLKKSSFKSQVLWSDGYPVYLRWV